MNIETFVANGMAAQKVIDQLRTINPAPFLCQSHVRQFLLDEARRTRAHKFTRVSGKTMIELNDVVRRWCVSRVAQLPSKGETI